VEDNIRTSILINGQREIELVIALNVTEEASSHSILVFALSLDLAPQLFIEFDVEVGEQVRV
jgi:hypothetical protein